MPGSTDVRPGYLWDPETPALAGGSRLSIPSQKPSPDRSSSSPSHGASITAYRADWNSKHHCPQERSTSALYFANKTRLDKYKWPRLCHCFGVAGRVEFEKEHTKKSYFSKATCHNIYYSRQGLHLCIKRGWNLTRVLVLLFVVFVLPTHLLKMFKPRRLTQAFKECHLSLCIQQGPPWKTKTVSGS